MNQVRQGAMHLGKITQHPNGIIHPLITSPKVRCTLGLIPLFGKERGVMHQVLDKVHRTSAGLFTGFSPKKENVDHP